MHVILKSIKKKGILVITHKELPFFACNNYLNYIVKNYYIILHIGANIPLPINDSRISFVALPDSRCLENKHIPLHSAFTPSYFYCEPTNKRNRFLCVSRATEIKTYKENSKFVYKLKFKSYHTILNKTKMINIIVILFQGITQITLRLSIRTTSKTEIIRV